MKTNLILLLITAFGISHLKASELTSIQKFDVKPGNSAAVNKTNLQKAIDWASASGAALFVEPSDEPYYIDGGIILKKNVSLIGVHGPTPRGTTHPSKKQPVGSVFAVTDRENPFITVESGTQIKGIQFWYPDQTIKDPLAIIPYKATIQVSQNSKAQGIYLSCLTFYGEYLAFDFNASRENPCELMTFEHCYGYPLSGEFIRIDYCYDVPRILHCHVNPATQRFIGGQYSRAVVDSVIAKKTFAYTINHTDNAQIIDLFTFGTYGGILLDGESYGQLTNFNFDCVAVGILKRGNNTKNRNWQIAQGSIIANTGEKVENIHPIIIEGQGHTSLSNVEAFSGGNGALTTVPENMSWDFLLVRGDKKLTVSVWGSRMRNYKSDSPVTIENNMAVIYMSGCFDKDENLYNKTIGSYVQSPSFDLKIEQLTSGSKHHLFGYIGQCRTIPWNASGRYILGLEIDTIDRMPSPGEAATIILIDTRENNKILRVDKTNAWNPQQGTMFYWNPQAPETQFFFNDRDVVTGEVFTVIYDIEKKKRVREYRYRDTPIGNGGVAADGSAWLGLNYGRLARLRFVTGYPGALDWSKNEAAPENDGIFIVDLKTGKKRLLVSYRQLEKKLKERDPELEHDGLFINHTLWNRDCDRIYFFVRAGWNGQAYKRINTPFSIRPDGTGLLMHEINIGGHPEWAEGSLLIGRQGKNQILYHADLKKVVGQIGNQEMFPDPEGDISLSPDGNWFVNGNKQGTENFYTVYRRSDGVYVRSEGIDKGAYSGDIRIDPAPQWNRTNDAILVPGIDKNKTRQMFLIRVIPRGE